MRSLLNLNKYFLRYKKLLIIGFICILFSNAAQIFIPLFLRESIDGIQRHFQYGQLLKYAALIIAAAVIAGVFRFLIRKTVIVVSRKIEYDLLHDFWAHVIKMPLRFFQNHTTGSLMALASNDIKAVRMYLGPAVMYSVDTLSRFIIIITIMIGLSAELTLYTLLPLPFLSFFVYQLSKKVHKLFARIQSKFSELTTKAQENFSGIRVIKSYVREESEIEEFRKLSREYLDRSMDEVRVRAFFMPILFLISGISIIIVVWAGGKMIINGSLTLGDVSAFIIYLGLLIWPMIAFGWVMNIIQQAAASMKRLLKIFNEKVEIEDAVVSDRTPQSIDGEIEFRNVSFRYRKDLPDILDNISLTIPKGTTAAVIGKTGTGKSTLINLLPRLYNVTGGEILIDGVNINEIPLSVLRKSIGLVPQDSFLFSDTLEANILYGAEISDSSLAEKAASISRMDKDITSFPNEFQTILGERGITLSGGQKQRTSLARALSVDPKILILDDSFSAVDTSTEEEILQNLKGFMRERTSIIISHRISTIKDADNIFVIQEGKIAEQGTHDELVALGGIYADIHYKQLLEDELKNIS